MSATTHPVVARYRGLRPEQLSRYELHRLRKQTDRGEFDLARSKFNKILVGGDDWAACVIEEIAHRTMQNFAHELVKLKQRRRSKEIAQRSLEGPKDPWRASQHGPMRELILTANAEWFNEAGDQATWRGMLAKRRREKDFEKCAVGWMKHTFGDDLVHARCDRDDKAYHIHAVIRSWREDQHGRWTLKPSAQKAVKSYEVTQDLVGKWFAQVGLTRGRTGAAERREAKEKGKAVPAIVENTPTWKWREQQQVEAVKEQAALDAQRASLVERERQIAEKEARLAKGFADLHQQHEDLEGRETLVNMACDVREAEVGARETAIASREAEADRKSEEGHAAIAKADRRAAEADAMIAEADLRTAEADATLAVAEGMATGVFQITAQDGRNTLTATEAAKTAGTAKPLIARIARSEGGAPRAVGIIGRAWAAMTSRAQVEAEERLHAEFAAVEATRTAILNLVKRLPQPLQDGLGTTWKSVAKHAVAAQQLLRKRGQSTGPETGPGRSGVVDPKNDPR
ncbi:hypothetical protein [Tropicibacter alexandrii]|uniref:hypothetical protein n=1 Tax=Tropicibacter alexandrii TaxID=2267683 RepID=UPI000EF462D9|nr:hypothetical protein [Tropicibacter alexandrii]